MKEAEKECRKPRMGAIPLLKELSLHGCRLRVLNMAAKLNTGTQTSRAIIKRISRKENITAPLSCTVDKSLRHLGAEIKAYKKG